MSRFAELPIASVVAGDRFRLFSAAHAEKLSVSFADYGRTAPIIVRPDPAQDGRYLLVAGMHRLEGAKASGLTFIDCDVRDLTDAEARRVEIAENVHRYELSALDRARSLAELAALWEAEHGKNAGGRPSKGSGKNRRQVGEGFARRFSAAAQAATGISERAIQRDVALAAALAPDVVALIAHTQIAGNAAQLQALARQPHSDQLLIARAIAAGEARNVTQARVAVGLDLPKHRDEAEEEFRKLFQAWRRAKPKTRRRFQIAVGLIDSETGEELAA